MTLAGNRPDERVAIRREGECPIDPVAHTRGLQHRVAFKSQSQFILDAIDILIQKLDPVIPRRAIHHPVLVIDLVNTKQHALLVVAHIGKAFKIDGQRQFSIQRRHFGDRIGQQIMVRQGRYRQFDTSHPANLLGPQASRIHNMLARNGALFGHHVPTVRRLVQFEDPVMFDDRGTVLLCSACIGQHRAGGINISLAVRPQPAKNTVG